MTELEFKFQIPRARLEELRTAVAAAGSRRVRLRAYYFDTDDGYLAQRGLSLRVRSAGRRWEQTLKAAGAGWIERFEHNVAVAVPAESATPVPDITLHAGTPAGDILAEALAHRDTDLPPVLLERYHTDIWRRTMELCEGDTRVELALDEGHIIAGGAERSASLPVCELEVELKEGVPATLVTIAQGLAAQYELTLCITSKAERGERLAMGQQYGVPVKAQPPALLPSMSRDTLLRTVVQNCLSQILPNMSEIVSGSDQAEHIHQLRVGLRRLRTGLRELGDFSAGVDPAWEPGLRAAFRQLGEYRDQDTVRLGIEARLQAAGAPATEWPQLTMDAQSPSAIVRGRGLQMILMQLIGFCVQQPVPAEAKPKKLKKELRSRLKKLHRKVVRDGKKFEQLQPAHQHRVRKRLKRLRYLSEFVASIFDPDAVEHYVSSLRPAQNVLGRHNDDVVALLVYRQIAEENPNALFAVGWLTAQVAVTAAQCQKVLRKMARTSFFER